MPVTQIQNLVADQKPPAEFVQVEVNDYRWRLRSSDFCSAVMCALVWLAETRIPNIPREIPYLVVDCRGPRHFKASAGRFVLSYFFFFF